MSDIKPVPMTPELMNRWQRAKEQTEAELPELLELGRQMQEACAENTLCGHLRRAVHHSARELSDVAAMVGITAGELNEFLSGQRNLRSDVLDRLAAAVDFAQTLERATPTAKD